MLDVHPPHAPTHTWKDFFIHIATIVVGLLIAVGLEQTVEYFHHRHQIAETRRAFDHELEIDKRMSVEVTAEFRRFVPILRTDLAVLHFLEAHPRAGMSEWPGEYRLRSFGGGFFSDSWKTARTNNIVPLLSDDEALRYADIFERLAILDEKEILRSDALRELRAVTMEDPDPSHLSPQRLEQAIDDAQKCLLMEANVAQELGNLAEEHPDPGFVAPSHLEIQQILPYLRTAHSDSDTQAVDAAVARLIQNDK